eukprot:scaffold76490_cov30-Phaeocystis_antarctica.AAC.1
MLDVLPREAVARSRAPTDPRGQERAIRGRGELRPTNAAAFHEQRSLSLQTGQTKSRPDALYFFMFHPVRG